MADKQDPLTGEVIPGLINEISGFTYDEEDYPSSQNKNSMVVFTPADVKDKDYYQVKKYQVLERFYKVKVPYYRVIDMQTQDEDILSQEEYAKFYQENTEAFEIGAFTAIEVLQTRVKVCASMGEVVLYEQILNTDSIQSYHFQIFGLVLHIQSLMYLGLDQCKGF